MLTVFLVAGLSSAALGPDRLGKKAPEARAPALPVYFVANQGQWPEGIRYRARAAGAQALFRDQGVDLLIKRPDGYQPLALRPLAASTSAEQSAGLQPGEPQQARFNFLKGGDKANSHSNIPSYGQLTYQGIFDGVDMVFRSENKALVYDFIVHPGADPARIQVALEGAQALAVSEDGELLITLPDGEQISQSAPVIYQEADGQRERVSGQFKLIQAAAQEGPSKSAPAYGFEIASYDRSRELVIDPTLNFFSYGGGGGDDIVTSMWVNEDGESFVAGYTESNGFALPVDDTNILTPDELVGTQAGTDGFIYKVGVDGALAWATILAGDGDDEVRDFAVYDSSGTVAPFMVQVIDITGFVVNGTGYTLTANGKSDTVTATAADGTGLDFAATPTWTDVTITTTADEIRLEWTATPTSDALATLVSGGSVDNLTQDTAGNATTPAQQSVTLTNVGLTTTDSYRLTADGMTLTAASLSSADLDALIAALKADPGYPFAPFTISKNTDATPELQLDWKAAGGPIAAGTLSQFSSTNEKVATKEVTPIDPSYDAIYLTGVTDSENFATSNAIYPLLIGGTDAFVARLALSGDNLSFSTYYGGTEDDAGNAIAIDPNGGGSPNKIYIAGITESEDLPLRNALYAFSEDFGGTTGFVLRMKSDGYLIENATYFGGDGNDSIDVIEIAENEDVYLAGNTESEQFPVTDLSISDANSGGIDMFVARLERGGDNLIFGTFIGGSGDDTLTDMVRVPTTDPDLFHYLISGYTDSTDFPLMNAVDEVNDGEEVDATLTKLDWTGTFLHFSTYLGGRGEDYAYSVAVDQMQDTATTTPTPGVPLKLDELDIYLGGETGSNVFPFEDVGNIPFLFDPTQTIQNFNAGNGDAFLTKLGPCGQSIYYSTFFGGPEADRFIRLRTRPADYDTTADTTPAYQNEVFIAGETESVAAGFFPPSGVAPSVDQPDLAGGIDTFTAYINGLDEDRLFPELVLGCNLNEVSPSGLVGVTDELNFGTTLDFPLTFSAPTGSEAIVSFSTKIYYDPDVLKLGDGAFEDSGTNTAANPLGNGVEWGVAVTGPLAGAGSFEWRVKNTPATGVLELEIQQFGGGSAITFGAAGNTDIATLKFAPANPILVTDDVDSMMATVQIEQNAPAVTNNGRSTILSGRTGSKIVRLRCGNLLGDCNCSGRVELAEYTTARTAAVSGVAPSLLCQKEDYDTLTALGASDITLIGINYTAGQAANQAAAPRSRVSSSQRLAADAVAAAASSAMAGLVFSEPRLSGGVAEVDLELDAGGLSIATLLTEVDYNPSAASVLGVTIGSAAQSSGKNLDSSSPTSGSLRILITALNANLIGSGTVATIRFDCASDCSNLGLTQVPDASDANGDKVAISAGPAVADPGAMPTKVVQLGAGAETTSISGETGVMLRYVDFGGNDTYNIASSLQGSVTIVDNQTSNIALPAGMTVNASQFATDGVLLTIGDKQLKLLGRPDLFTFDLAGAQQLSLSDFASLFGVSNLGSSPTSGSSGTISASGGLN
ncbi:hypothetical protein CCR91_20405 [Thiorhodovibrio winogradskyi]|nr:hypothetical protein [Thiorhodovibrio winogradskyi]